MTLIKSNTSKPKRYWDHIASVIQGDRKALIDKMAVDGSFVAIEGEEVIYEVE